MKHPPVKAILFVIVAALAVCFFAFHLGQYLTLSSLKAQQRMLQDYYLHHRAWTIFLYMGVYIAVTALSLPGALVMSLAGAAIFGFWVAAVAVSFASSIGATLAFLVSRFLLRDWVQDRFGKNLAAINEGIRKDGPFYLFTLRLVPVFPFFIINLLMGLTPIGTPSFYLVSQIGMLPGTLVYVNAGTQLAAIDSLHGILSPGLLASFALLGIFPLVAKKSIAIIRRRRTLSRWPRPKRVDYNLVVIGAGAAGLVSAYIAAAVKAKVAIVEKDRMGGDCLNTGCVPSKAFIRSAKILHTLRAAESFGIRTGPVSVDFAAVMERVARVIEKIAPHDSAERYTALGVEVVRGTARIVSPHAVSVNGRTLTTRAIVVATGATPFVPPIPGLSEIDYFTSDTIWQLRHPPRRLVVLGGGPIGCELAQAFSRLGAEVSQVEMMPQIMGREDEDIAEWITRQFRKEGIRVLTGHRAKEVRTADGVKTLICEHGGEEVAIEFDAILVAVGRAAGGRGLGLEELGVEVGKNGTPAVNGLLQTSIPTIFCAGDVVGPYAFTHMAGHQAWYAAVNALFGRWKTFAVDYRVIPWATYTDPEVARVGLNEREAREKGIAYEKTTYGIDDLDRAITEGEDHGFVRVLTKPGTDRILGATIVSAHAGEIIAEIVFAMKHRIGLSKILGTIHIYPTFGEANRQVAGQWKQTHAPAAALKWIERYHSWMRGRN